MKPEVLRCVHHLRLGSAPTVRHFRHEIATMGGGGAEDTKMESKKRKKEQEKEAKEMKKDKKREKVEDKEKKREKEEKREKKKAKKEKEEKKKKKKEEDAPAVEPKEEAESEPDSDEKQDEEEEVPLKKSGGKQTNDEEQDNGLVKKSAANGPHKVYAGGFSYYATEEEIKGLFEDCGKVVEVDMMTFPDTGRFRGIAFISFEDENGVEAAVKYDNTDYNGRYLRIRKYEVRAGEGREGKNDRKSQFRTPPAKISGYNVAYVGNLPWSIDEDGLRNFFKDYQIEDVRLAKDRDTGKPRGFAHVTFSSEADLDGAMQLDGQMLQSRPLRLGYGQK